jgi:hypothetical protein
MGNEASKESQDLSAVIANESTNEVDEVVQKALAQGINSLPSTDITIRISASDLPHTDKGSLTDPYAALYIKNGASDFQYLGITEVISNTLNPAFIKQFTTKFFFEEKQILQLNIYDKGTKGNLENFNNQECVGSVTATLAEVFALKEKSFNLNNKHSKGKAKIQCEVVKESRIIVNIKMQLPIANAFLLISKRQQSWCPIYKSEVTQNCLSDLKTIHVTTSLLCDNDYALPIQFQVYIHSKSGNHKLQGELCMTLTQLIETQELKTGGTSDYVGITINVKTKIEERPTFLDYVMAGYNISMGIGIDFTASNGEPHTPGSLHSNNLGMIMKRKKSVRKGHILSRKYS